MSRCAGASFHCNTNVLFRPDLVWYHGVQLAKHVVLFGDLKSGRIFSPSAKGQLANAARELIHEQPARLAGGVGRVTAFLANFENIVFFEFEFKALHLNGALADYTLTRFIETPVYPLDGDGARYLHVMLNTPPAELGYVHAGVGAGHA